MAQRIRAPDRTHREAVLTRQPTLPGPRGQLGEERFGCGGDAIAEFPDDAGTRADAESEPSGELGIRVEVYGPAGLIERLEPAELELPADGRLEAGGHAETEPHHTQARAA